MGYGIKVSKPNYDVLTADIKNLTYTSDAESHKVSATGTVTINTDITHGLGYAPMVDLYFTSDGAIYKGGVTYNEDLGGIIPQVYAYVTSTQVKIIIERYGYDVGTVFYVIFYEGYN